MSDKAKKHLRHSLNGFLAIVVSIGLCMPGTLAFAESSSASATDKSQAQSARYTVLVLDVSGPETFVLSEYLSGTSILRAGGPEKYTADSSIEEVKAAASQFVDDSQYSLNNSMIAVVAYASEATVVSGFTNDRDKLKSAISGLQEISEGEEGADRNISAGLDCASNLLSSVDDKDAIKNILLCTTGLTDTGDYSYEGRYDESATGSTWQNMETEIRLYAYANIAIASADRIKNSGTTIYVIGIFEPIESGMPSEGRDVAEFLRITARDLASAEGLMYPVEDPEKIEFTFGEVQAELIGSALTRIYNDANYGDGHALVEKNADSDMQGSFYEEMLWGPDLFDTPATRMHLQSITTKDSPNYNLAMLCGSLSATAYNERYLHHAYNSLGFDDDDIFLYSYPSSELNRKDALLDGKNFAANDTFAFSIASREMVFNDVGIGDLVIINLCGTHNLTEGMKDKLAKANQDFYGYTAYDLICDYRDEVFAGLDDFYSEHKDLGKRPLKFVITGHSLAGAGANLVAAQLNLETGGNSWYSKNVTSDDIYAYTFGAIDSISKGQWQYELEPSLTEGDGGSSKSLGANNTLTYSRESEHVDVTMPVTKGFENITNVYNYLDTFGPYWHGVDHLGITAPAGDSMCGKFGVFSTFSKGDMTGVVDSESKWPTHEIAGYLAALRLGWPQSDAATDYIRISIRCPVDVNVYKDGELVLSVIDDKVSANDAAIDAAIEEGAKTFALPKSECFNVEITATASGTMQYEAADLDLVNQASITYENVALEDGKRMNSDIEAGARANSVELFVLDDSGERIARVETKGVETELEKYVIEEPGVKPSFELDYRCVLLVCIALAVVGTLAMISLRRRHKVVATRNLEAAFGKSSKNSPAIKSKMPSDNNRECECGTTNPLNAKYCRKCGRPLD